jgi:hypothetical protein
VIVLSRFNFFRIALALLITSSGIAGCSSPDATPTPMTVVPTVTPTIGPPTPTPTPMPPAAEEAVASARAVASELKAYRFSLSTTQADVVHMEVTGIWAVPGFYDAVVSVPVCPPAVPGAPAPRDCLLLPAYQEVMLDGVAYSRAPTPSNGEWVRESLLFSSNRGFVKKGVSPALQLLSGVDLHQDVVVSEMTVGDVPAYQIVSRSAKGEITRIRIDRQSSQLLSVQIVANGLNEEWTFSSHDEALAVLRPIPSTTANPVDWLEHKVVRLIEDDSSFPSGQLRPFSASDEPIVTALVSAFSGGRTIPNTGIRPQGRMLTIHFTDGTFFTLAQAFSHDHGGRVADSWYIQGESSVVVRASALTAWWSHVDDYFPPLSNMTWPSSVTTGQLALFSGRGWPDEVVILSTVINERNVEFGEARTRKGVWAWEGSVPVAVQPGTMEVTVGGKTQGLFVHKPQSQVIAVDWPGGFQIRGRQAYVVYVTGASSFPVSAPLWSGKVEHREAVQELIAIVNDALTVVAPTSKVDRSSTLHIVHPDSTKTLFTFAGDCGVFTTMSVCSDNRWSVTHVDSSGEHVTPETYIDAPDLSAWWKQQNILATTIEPLKITETEGQSISISGEGWATGTSVTVLIMMDGSELISTHADLHFGEFSLEIKLLPMDPGRLDVTVIGQGVSPLVVTRSTDYK